MVYKHGDKCFTEAHPESLALGAINDLEDTSDFNVLTTTTCIILQASKRYYEKFGNRLSKKKKYGDLFKIKAAFLTSPLPNVLPCCYGSYSNS